MIRSNPPRSSGEPPSLGAFVKAFGLLLVLGAGFLVALALFGKA